MERLERDDSQSEVSDLSPDKLVGDTNREPHEDRGPGKRHYATLHNRPTTNIDPHIVTRRYIPHGYGHDGLFKFHPVHVEPQYTDFGLDWTSRLRWLPAPSGGESAKFTEIWPDTSKSLRTYPGAYGRSESYWVLHPEGVGTSLRCTFNGSHKASELSYNEVQFFSAERYLADKRNGIPMSSPGDKCYRTVEYSPDFHKQGSTLPLVNFGGSCQKKRFDTFIPLINSSRPLSESFRKKDGRRQKEEEVFEVAALEKWKPASPLVGPVLATGTNPSRRQIVKA